MPESTRIAFEADWNDWAHHCLSVGVAPLPAQPDVLANYVGLLLSTGSSHVASPRPLAPATVRRRLVAITARCRTEGHGTPDLERAHAVLDGHRHLYGEPLPAQAAPITAGALKALVAQTQCYGPTVRAIRDRCAVLLGFATAARRSELVAVDIQDLLVTTEGLRVRLLRHKTRKVADLVPVPWAATAELCPVRATLALRDALADRGITEGPLFRQVSRSDRPLPYRLAAEGVTDIVARLAQNAGLAVPDGYRSWSAHGLRRGMASAARAAGADMLQIARQGGWSDTSTALARYIAEADQWSNHPLTGVL